MLPSTHALPSSSMSSSGHPLNIMIRKLGGSANLSKADERAIAGLPMTTRTMEPYQSIVHEGDPSTHCCIVLQGWTCCFQSLAEGRRQILSFHVPGDLPDLQSLHLPGPDFGMAAVTRAVVAFIPHANLISLADASKEISISLWRQALVAAAIHRAWMTSIGRRDARQRLAHLFCELYLRLKAVGLVEGATISMPIRQPDLADALGLTSVHVNRTLKAMRTEGLVNLHMRKLTIQNWTGLSAAAEFNPHYLRLEA